MRLQRMTKPESAVAQRDGFTLVELLVALAAMALIAVLSWRGLDGMARSQAITQAHTDEVLTLQAGLAQWGADLDAMVQTPQLSAIDWDGQVLRITRRATGDPREGVQVVAWTRRAGTGARQWLRWQSLPRTTRGELQAAWQQAGVWAQSPGDAERLGEVPITTLDGWQIFYYRSDAWTNPMSSDATASSPAAAAAPATPVALRIIPDGVRLVLDLPAGQALPGRITRDWARPVLGGGKS
jgi:general secretion pathway protein J